MLQHFHDVAYKADGRSDLLDAINEFLDDSLVLPPGEWDKKTLLPIMDMARQKIKKKQRKKRLQEEGKRSYFSFMFDNCVTYSIYSP